MNAPAKELALKVIPEDAAYDRTKYIGGSNVASIMGLGAYEQTSLSTYLQKTGQALEVMDEKKKLFLNRRKRWEGPIIEMLREEFDAEIVSINRRYQDPEFDFMAAEIDFEWRDTDGTIQNGEIKTVSPFNFGERQGWGEPGTDEIPVHYACQVMHGLGLTGRRTCIVAAMVGLDSIIFYRVDRDDETITEMRALCVTFWRENVLKLVPPEPVSLADVIKLTTRMNGKPVEITAEIKTQVDKLVDIRAQKKNLEFAEETVAFEVFNFVRLKWGSPGAVEPKDLPDDNAVLLFDGKKYATWNRQRGASLDQKLLKEEKPEIVKQYQREYFFRTLRVPKPKQ